VNKDDVTVKTTDLNLHTDENPFPASSLLHINPVQNKVFPYHSKRGVLFLTEKNKSNCLQVKPGKDFKQRLFWHGVLWCHKFQIFKFSLVTCAIT